MLFRSELLLTRLNTANEKLASKEKEVEQFTKQKIPNLNATNLKQESLLQEKDREIHEISLNYQEIQKKLQQFSDLLKEERNQKKDLQEESKELYDKGIEEGLKASKTEINKLTMKCQIYKEKAIQAHNKAKTAKEVLLQWKEKYAIPSTTTTTTTTETDRVEKSVSSTAN